MDYQVLELVYPYLDKKESIFQALVCKEWLEIIKSQGQGSFVTPYSILTTPSLLSYSNEILSLVNTHKVAVEVIKIGNLETIKYLHSTYDLCLSDSNYMDISAKYGSLETMKWLLKNGSKLDIHTFNAAVRNGNLLAMKWLLDNGCGFSYGTLDLAVKNGTIENLKWLIEKGCKFSYYTFDYAAENGSLETMKWLLENGCQFTPNTFNYSSENGTLENMKWLEENGCPH